MKINNVIYLTVVIELYLVALQLGCNSRIVYIGSFLLGSFYWTVSNGNGLSLQLNFQTNVMLRKIDGVFLPLLSRMNGLLAIVSAVVHSSVFSH